MSFEKENNRQKYLARWDDAMQYVIDGFIEAAAASDEQKQSALAIAKERLLRLVHDGSFNRAFLSNEFSKDLAHKARMIQTYQENYAPDTLPEAEVLPKDEWLSGGSEDDDEPAEEYKEAIRYGEEERKKRDLLS